MKRKHIKLILLITGVLIFTAGMAVFIINAISRAAHSSPGLKNMMNEMILPFYSCTIISIIPLSITCLMHSKDIIDTKKDLSRLLKGLSWFWIIGGAVSVIALIMISVFFIK